jgi:TrmH family RNA methyltransferase
MLSSPSHPLIKQARRLKQRKYRTAERRFLLEGIRAFIEAVDSDAAIETILASPDLLTSARAREAIATARTHGAQYHALTPTAFAALSDRDNPTGLAAIIHFPHWRLDDLPHTPTSFYVALEAVHDPGNLGTILRTLDGAGAAGVFLLSHTTDPYHPAAVRASMGALFTIPLIPMSDIAALRSWCRQRQVTIVATTPTAPATFWEAQYPLPTLLFMGSEAQGLSDEALRACDLAVRIPMLGKADSLNLAVATALLAYELQRRLPPSPLPWRGDRG